MEPRPYTTRNFVICVQIWYTAVGRLHSFCRSIAIFVSVCLSVGLYPSARMISQKRYVQTSRYFLYMLPVAVRGPVLVWRQGPKQTYMPLANYSPLLARWRRG